MSEDLADVIEEGPNDIVRAKIYRKIKAIKNNKIITRISFNFKRIGSGQIISNSNIR